MFNEYMIELQVHAKDKVCGLVTSEYFCIKTIDSGEQYNLLGTVIIGTI